MLFTNSYEEHPQLCTQNRQLSAYFMIGRTVLCFRKKSSYERKRVSRGFVTERNSRIPACAGMTEMRVFRCLRNHRPLVDEILREKMVLPGNIQESLAGHLVAGKACSLYWAFRQSEPSMEEDGHVLGDGGKGIGKNQNTDNNQENAGYELENSDHLLEPVEQNEKFMQSQG